MTRMHFGPRLEALLAFVDEKRRDEAMDAPESAIRRVHPDGNAPAERRSDARSPCATAWIRVV
ncbi:MAG: hypothetical protein DMF97_01085 [Acidobacteria bacterium]|nr:MAG: hypothetical protein DMF97_01085 [Acidobacteriota bacterium]